jgi:hypothetical protein
MTKKNIQKLYHALQAPYDWEPAYLPDLILEYPPSNSALVTVVFILFSLVTTLSIPLDLQNADSVPSLRVLLKVTMSDKSSLLIS